jgi:hypothetical protein
MSGSSRLMVRAASRPFSLVLGRHADVGDDQVGLLIADEAQQLRGVARLARDLEP